MCQQLIAHPGDFISMRGDALKTTSLKVAEAFSKLHKDVLKKLEGLDCSPEFTERNFALSEYTDPTGRKLPLWEMTKDGFMFLVMGFTGKRAAGIKEAYINAFNAMATELETQRSTNPIRLYRSQQANQSRVLLTIENGLVVDSSPLSEDDIVTSLIDIRQLMEREGYHLVHGPTLWDITAMAASLMAVNKNLMASVHRLEEDTGRQWYGRQRP